MKIISILTGFLIVIVTSFWWLMLEGTPPLSAPDEFNISDYRQLTAEHNGNRPKEVRIEYVGTDVAPGFAAETGDFDSKYHTVYTSIQLVWADQTIVIGGALDLDGAIEMRQSEEKAVFDQDSYDRVISSMLDAKYVTITHAHPDHVMAVARHPSPSVLAPKLRLNKQQINTLPLYENNNELSKAIAKARVNPIRDNEPTLIAPGVVVIPNIGHSLGSQSFFVTLSNGREYLLIGDIVWTMSNIENLKTRPRILQYLLFEPNEDRAKVLSQVRALHDLHNIEPELTIVPSHDLHYLDSLIEQNLLQKKFVLSSGRL